MGERLTTMIKWIERHPWRSGIVLLGIIVFMVYAAITIRTVGFAEWLGVKNKTIWDVLELVIIPLVLAVAAYWFNRSERETDRDIAEQNLREVALQAYLDRMTGLMLEKGLLDDKAETHESALLVARTRTLTVLPGLDAQRKGAVVRFLYEAGLLKKDIGILGVGKAEYGGADLRGANLRGAYLSESDWSKADLSGADLTSTNLFKARLKGTKLSGANLSDAYLKGADVDPNELETAISLSGTTMPDGSKHE